MSVEAVWKDVERWLEDNAPKARAVLRPGAAPDAIDRLEVAIGLPLPPELRALLALHDGQRVPPFLGTVAGFLLLSCEEAARIWREQGELLDAGDLARPGRCPDETVQPVWWSKRWIPFAEGGGGDLLCVDLGPGPRGLTGQVLRFWHDGEQRAQLAPGVEALLASFLADLRRGVYRVNDLGGVELS